MPQSDDILEAGLEPQDLPMPSEQLDSFDPVKTDLGIVCPAPKGVYDPEATYEYLNIVQYGGCSYICRKETLTGVTPVDGEDWMLLTDKNGALPSTGGTMTGDIDMNGHKIKNILDSDGYSFQIGRTNEPEATTSMLCFALDKGFSLIRPFPKDAERNVAAVDIWFPIENAEYALEDGYAYCGTILFSRKKEDGIYRTWDGSGIIYYWKSTNPLTIADIFPVNAVFGLREDSSVSSDSLAYQWSITFYTLPSYNFLNLFSTCGTVKLVFRFLY